MSDLDNLQRWHNTKLRNRDIDERIECLEWGLRHYWVYHPCASKCRLHQRDHWLDELAKLKERQGNAEKGSEA